MPPFPSSPNTPSPTANWFHLRTSNLERDLNFPFSKLETDGTNPEITHPHHVYHCRGINTFVSAWARESHFLFTVGHARARESLHPHTAPHPTFLSPLALKQGISKSRTHVEKLIEKNQTFKTKVTKNGRADTQQDIDGTLVCESVVFHLGIRFLSRKEAAPRGVQKEKRKRKPRR